MQEEKIMKKICPSCQAQYDEKPKFCLKCGTPLVEMPEEEAPTVMLGGSEPASPFKEESRAPQTNGTAGPKFCMKCGAPISGTEKFCVKCGAPLPGASGGAMAGSGASAGSAPGGYGSAAGGAGGGFTPGAMGGTAAGAGKGGKKPNNKMIGIIAVAAAAVAVVAIVIAVVVTMTSAYKKPIKNMEKFLNDPSVERYYDLFADNDDVLDAIGGDEDYTVEYMEDMFESQAGGEDYKIKLKVVGKEKNDTDDVEKLYRQEGDVRLDVSNAYELDVKVSFKSDEYSFERNMDMYVMKVDGKWMFDALSSGGLF